jgi:ribosome biogenesis GTPase
MVSKIDLHDIGLSDQYVQEALAYGTDLHLARVSAQHRDIYRVITAGGDAHAVVSGKLGFAASTAADYPVVGDWVGIRASGNCGEY